MTAKRSAPGFAGAAPSVLAFAVFLHACGGSKDSTPTAPPPVLTTVVVTVSQASLTVGQTATANAAGLDQHGASIGVGTVVWSSAAPSIASVSASGLVTGVSAGQTAIVATAGGKQGQQLITVTLPPAATVTVAPTTATLAVGGTRQLTATTLDAGGNVLSGRVVVWTTSDATKASVSASGLVTAVAAGTATISATSEDKSGTSVVTVTSAAASVTLAAAGQSMTFLDSPSAAPALAVQAGSQYIVTVVNTDPSFTIKEDFTLNATFGSLSASQRVAGPLNPPATVAGSVPGATGPRPMPPRPSLQVRAMRRQAVRNHLAMLEQNRQVYARLFSQGLLRPRLPARDGRNLPVSAAVSQSVGNVNKVYVPKFGNNNCNSADSIGARTVAVGQHVIILADTDRTAWPQAYRPDSSYYLSLANEYDQVTFPELLAYIGNPLAYDGSLSGVGKVTVTLTPKLNGASLGGQTVSAFVNFCDFAPFVASGPNKHLSNQTEMVYSYVPSANAESVASLEAGLRSTLAHESKHLVSVADRILLGAEGIDATWLEEGLAQVSVEIWERNFNQATWKGHATFAQTVACEYNLSAFGYPCDAANDKPKSLMYGQMQDFFEYLQNESTSNSEGFGATDGPTDYGAGWAFARWVIDQYASADEGTFIKSLINTTATGLTNLSARTGQSIPLLLTYWNLTSAVFQTPGYTAADVRTTIPSFNFAQIFQVGQTGWTCGGTPCGFFSSPPTVVYPVQPIPFNSGPFSRTVLAVPGTSASFFLLSGATAGVETLQLLSGTGGALSGSSGFRLAILRVK